MQTQEAGEGAPAIETVGHYDPAVTQEPAGMASGFLIVVWLAPHSAQ
jgi:ribosomal protein S16